MGGCLLALRPLSVPSGSFPGRLNASQRKNISTTPENKIKVKTYCEYYLLSAYGECVIRAIPTQQCAHVCVCVCVLTHTHTHTHTRGCVRVSEIIQQVLRGVRCLSPDAVMVDRDVVCSVCGWGHRRVNMGSRVTQGSFSAHDFITFENLCFQVFLGQNHVGSGKKTQQKRPFQSKVTGKMATQCNETSVRCMSASPKTRTLLSRLKP